METEEKRLKIGIVGCGKKVITAAISHALSLQDDNRIDLVNVEDEKPDVVFVVGSAGRGNLAEFARRLVEITDKEVQKLAQILEEEFGIVPAPALVFENRPEPVLREGIIPKLRRKEKKGYHVPKKIGKVNSKPKK